MRQAGAWGDIQAQRAEPEVFYVLPECAPVLAVWNAVHTQWRWVSGMAGSQRVGLDYAGVRASPVFCAIRRRRQREEMLADLCVMETAWLVERARIAEEQRAERELPPVG